MLCDLLCYSLFNFGVTAQQHVNEITIYSGTATLKRYNNKYCQSTCTLIKKVENQLSSDCVYIHMYMYFRVQWYKKKHRPVMHAKD